MNPAQLLEQCITWAKNQEAVRALVLVGSRAKINPVDAYADIDLLVFTNDPTMCQDSDEWLTPIGTPWVCVHDTVQQMGTLVPTRLVIFAGGVKVDFTISSAKTSNFVAHAWWQKGQCVVLVDKDKALKSLQRPYPKLKEKKVQPTQQEFERIVNEFWFEVYHVAKYLGRGDLWNVKLRDWAAKGFLHTMLEWSCDPKSWKSLHSTFAHYDTQDSWKCLFETMKLFRKVAKRTAKQFSLEYPVAIDKNISTYIKKVEICAQ